MKLFANFISEANLPGGASHIPEQKPQISEDLVSVFGRHNPPHKGHGLTFDRAHSIAKSIGDQKPADQSFYTSRVQKAAKDPLPHGEKIHFLKQMFPKHADKWDTDPEVRTVLNAAQKAHGKGYKNFHYVGGDDRRQGIEDLLRRYNGNLYQFDNMYAHSAGPRDPDDEGVAGMSATKLRSAAKNDDFESFGKFMPNVEGFDPRELFQRVQEYGSGSLGEQEVRDLYHTNQIYLVGEIVESRETGMVGEVHRRGANHLICVTEDGIMFKSFLSDVQSV